MNVFKIEAVLSICLYQRLFTFVTSFGCDTLITIQPFVLIQLCSDSLCRPNKQYNIVEMMTFPGVLLEEIMNE